MINEKTNIICGKKYRISVLTPCMIRLEYSEKEEFVDDKSQLIVNRNFPVPEYRVEETEDELQIITENLRMTYNKQRFSSHGLKIDMNGSFFCFSSVWHYGDEPNDLKGTARTLDGGDGAIPLERGILSAEGWSLLNDKGSLLLDEDGWIKTRKDMQADDIYFFGYGREYLKCLKDYHHLTGGVPLLPKYALGNWWSRYYSYNEQSYMDLMNRFEGENIPFTVAVIDMDWHITEVDFKYGTGWTGYTWNKELFPDPKRFMKNLHDKGLKVTLNVHPADGVRAFEDCYKPFAQYMGVNDQNEDPITFQVGNKKFMEGYFKYVHHPLEAEGVDFWWIDWQQGNNSGIQGLDPLWMLNHYHYLDMQRGGKRRLILSRYSGPGSHRYPVGFSGDSIISWKSLAFQPYFTATASNIGYGWWSHDIGGHTRGIKDDELAVRWLQFGVFSPIMRLHSSNSEFNGKEPWRYNLIAEKTMKKFLRLRHKMIPYLNTMNYIAAKESIPLLQPLYYCNAYHQEAYQVPNEYYFGSEMIVCPITQPIDKRTEMALFSGWLPEGIWIDFFNGMKYEGGRKVDFYRPIEQIPVLMKAGAIIPFDAREEGNDLNNSEILEVHICAGASGQFDLMEDVDDTLDDQWCRTIFKYEENESASFIIEPIQGIGNVIPDNRTYKLIFRGVKNVHNVTVIIDEELCGCNEYFAEEIQDTFKVSISSTQVNKRIMVKFAYNKSENNIKSKIFEFLNKAQISFDLKNDILEIINHLQNGKSVPYIEGELVALNIDSHIMGPINEILLS